MELVTGMKVLRHSELTELSQEHKIMCGNRKSEVTADTLTQRPVHNPEILHGACAERSRSIQNDNSESLVLSS